MKTYGYKTLISILLFASWTYIFVGDEINIFIPACIGYLLIALLFVPLIKIGNYRIHITPLNPLARRIDIALDDISKLEIHAGNIRFSMTFELKNGETIQTASFFRYYDMESLFQHLYDAGVPVTSTGVRAINWER